MGIIERKEREKERRRQEIIMAAEKVIFRDGIDHTTMDNVAQQAELSKATLYLYFNSKEELYYAIYLKGQTIFFEMIEEAIRFLIDPKDKIIAFLKTMTRFQKNYPNYFDAFFYFITHDTANIDEKSSYFKQSRETARLYMQKWFDLVQKGKKDGHLRPDLSEKNTAIILWVQLIGFLKIFPHLEKILEKEYQVQQDKILNDYFDLNLKGMLVK